MTRSVAGARIRACRKERGITQAELARRIGISPSYLNLIESSKRAIAGRLLTRAAEELGVGVEHIDGAAERRLVDQLQDLAADPRLERLGARDDDAPALTGRFPGWARMLAALARSERELAAANRQMSDRLTHDPVLGEAVHRMLTHIASLRSAAEILRDVADLDPEQRARFIEIIADESVRLSDVGAGLAGYFDRTHSLQRAITPTDELEALLEAHANHFPTIEEAAGDLRLRRAAIEEIVATAPELESDLARERARARLERYGEDAAALPLSRTLKAVRDHRYDVELIAHDTNVAVSTVFRRLASLPPEIKAPRFGYLETNAAGVTTDFLAVPGLAPPRHGAVCPIWVNFRAATEPERTLCQVAEFPTGLRFVFVARAHRVGPAGFGQSPLHMVDMLAMSDTAAQETVYGAALSGSAGAEAVGRSCGICPRETCAHRVPEAQIAGERAPTRAIAARDRNGDRPRIIG